MKPGLVELSQARIIWSLPMKEVTGLLSLILTFGVDNLLSTFEYISHQTSMEVCIIHWKLLLRLLPNWKQ